MCGICGCLDPTGVSDDDARSVRCMMNDLAHRGPDASGFLRAGQAALGHRRLSIIDLRTEANQPLINEDGSIALIVNGEIYNYKALRDELLAKGHRFRSYSDCEVILHLYEEEGIECLARLRGMFAFALWDGSRRQLFVARDRLGKKPLYYAASGRRFFFASELRALHRALPWQTEVDLDAIDKYLTLQYVPAPLTIWTGVKKLPAGHYLTVEPGNEARCTRYFKLSFAPEEPISPGNAVAEVRALVEEAVALRTVADVPYGAFLSGGLDSSTVVAILARKSTKPIATFSIDLPWGDGGEARYARLVARQYQTDHHELTVRPDMVRILPDIVRRYGEPFGDPSAVPTYYLAELTRRSVAVALSGDGADEAFAGYTRYRFDRLARAVANLPRPLPALLSGLLTSLPGHLMRPAREFAAHQELSEAERYLFFLAHFTRRDKESIVGPALKERAFGNRVVRDFERILAASDACDPINRLLDLDIQTYLPDDILTKVDIASMAHGLEVRAPFSDHVLHERVARLAGTLKLHGMHGKRVLREAVRDLLPPRILARGKQGFNIPLGRWMRGELASLSRDILTDQVARSRGLFDTKSVVKLLDEHRAGAEHGERLWNLTVLELWFREFMGGQRLRANTTPIGET